MDFNNIEFDNLFNVINQIFLIPDCLDKAQFKFYLINSIPDINIKNYYLKKGYKLYEKVGISGLEREYEEYLKWTNAKYKVNNDNSLTLISHGKKGSDLYLSIDINLVNEINTIIKEELVKAKKHLNTQYLNDAFVIVGNPKTSEVYSLNGQRYLNDNTFTDISLNNINSAFTMGSVVKGATRRWRGRRTRRRLQKTRRILTQPWEMVLPPFLTLTRRLPWPQR